jgi:Fic family protein
MAEFDERRRSVKRLERLTRDVLHDGSAAAAALESARLATTRETLRLEEALASTALAGYRLDAVAGAALLARGVALGGQRLEVYEAVADYADAARLIASLEPRPVRPHTYLRTEELLELHRRAMHRTGHAPGAWRERNVGPVGSGLIPPAHWLVPREVAAFIDRHAAGPAPSSSPLLYAAAAHARLLRIQPFDGGNGRVARLVANLLLHRLGLPPAAFGRRRFARYAPAIASADSGDLGPLTELTAEAVHESITRLLAGCAPDDLRPLRSLAPESRLAALVKAAQRGRLRIVRRGTRFFTTAAWLDEYESAQRTPAEPNGA